MNPGIPLGELSTDSAPSPESAIKPRVLALDQRVLLADLPAQNGALAKDAALRVGLVLPARAIPVWMRDFVDWFSGIPQFKSAIYSIDSRPPGFERRPPGLFERLHNYSRKTYDPFAITDLDSAYRIQTWAEEQHSSATPPELDVLVWLLTAEPPHEAPLRLARFGCISIRTGVNGHYPPYWDETARGDLFSEAAMVWHTKTFDRGRPVRTAKLVTDQGLRFTRNAERPLIAAAEMAAGICLDMLRRGTDWCTRAEAVPEMDTAWGGPPTAPSALATTSFVCRKMLRSAHLRIAGAGRPREWFIALRRRNENGQRQSRPRSAAGNYCAVPSSPGAEMADPFLAEQDGRTYLYFEEVPAGTSKGRLCCAEVRDDGTLDAHMIILETTGHLSYPCVFQHHGEFFMIPESSDSGRIDLYRATRFPAEFRFETTLLSGFTAVDTTPVFVDGRWYFFTSTGDPFPQTMLFFSERLDGRWHLHPGSPVSCSIANSRSAGAIAMSEGRLVRPSQDCSHGYGYAIALNEITKLTPHEFEERQLDRILPTWHPKLLGTHTINFSSRFEVIDGVRFRA